MQFPLNIRCVPKAGNLRLICIYNLILDFLCENRICTRLRMLNYSVIFNQTLQSDKLCTVNASYTTGFFRALSVAVKFVLFCVCVCDI